MCKLTPKAMAAELPPLAVNQLEQNETNNSPVINGKPVIIVVIPRIITIELLKQLKYYTEISGSSAATKSDVK